MKNNFIKLCIASMLCSPATNAQTLQKNAAVQSNVQTNRFAIQKGAAAFSTPFNKTATGRSDVNAYLLCYITTLIYPQYLSIVSGDPSEGFIDRMHNNINNAFENEYKKRTSFLFENADYKFVNESHPAGYDPEAMVISTSDAVYVVFRGTDRVASNTKTLPGGSFMYDWGEWLLSDFDARLTTAPDIKGQIHTGFWNSLSYKSFKDQLVQAIREKGGDNKKVWITGHSLGSAHAQIFAMYLAKKGITAQGVYVYAAPHPGNQEFANELEKLFPGNRLQRFDFSNDPVTMLAPYSFGYARAGTRVFYKDIRSIEFGAQERSAAEATAVFAGISGAAGFNLGGMQFCFHHPTWYLRAAYKQLNASQREKVPSPLPLPDPTSKNGYSEGCDVLSVNKGRNANNAGSAVEEGIVAVTEGLEKLQFAANAIMDNVTGNAIAEGDYYISAYPSSGKLGLNEVSGLDNGNSMKLTTARSKVSIKRYGAAGYTISFGVRNGKEYVLDSKADDLFDDGSTTVQLWEKNLIPGLSANQRWLFIKVKENKYVIKCLANGKLLDANNSCVNSNECGVKTWDPVNNDQTQIWVVEKAN